MAVKVLDFGIAKVRADGLAANDDQNLTRTGSLIGSPLFMSPEQARGVKNLDGRADLWSLGVVLYEALTGSTPNADKETLGDLLISICMEDPPPLQERAPWVSPELTAIVERALARDLSQRFASAERCTMRWSHSHPAASASARTCSLRCRRGCTRTSPSPEDDPHAGRAVLEASPHVVHARVDRRGAAERPRLVAFVSAAAVVAWCRHRRGGRHRWARLVVEPRRARVEAIARRAARRRRSPRHRRRRGRRARRRAPAHSEERRSSRARTLQDHLHRPPSPTPLPTHRQHRLCAWCEWPSSRRRRPSPCSTAHPPSSTTARSSISGAPGSLHKLRLSLGEDVRGPTSRILESGAALPPSVELVAKAPARPSKPVAAAVSAAVPVKTETRGTSERGTTARERARRETHVLKRVFS